MGTRCLACSKGKYLDEDISASCIDCPVGFFSTQVNATVCQICPAGYNSTVSGEKKCNRVDVERFDGSVSISCTDEKCRVVNITWDVARASESYEIQLSVGSTLNFREQKHFMGLRKRTVIYESAKPLWEK